MLAASTAWSVASQKQSPGGVLHTHTHTKTHQKVNYLNRNKSAEIIMGLWAWLQKQPLEVFLEVSQNSQENTCARGLQLYWKRDSSTGVFLWILQNFLEHLFNRSPLRDCFCDSNSEKEIFAEFIFAILLQNHSGAIHKWRPPKIFRF